MMYPNPCCSKFFVTFLNISVIIAYILPIFPFQPQKLFFLTTLSIISISYYMFVSRFTFTQHTCVHTQTHSHAHMFWGFVQCLLFKNGIMVYPPLCISPLSFKNTSRRTPPSQRYTTNLFFLMAA